MILYDEGVGFLFLFQLRGSVFPKAFKWALPSALAAIVVHLAAHMGKPNLDESSSGSDLSAALGSVYFALAFMLVFRTQQAYSRYWSGATLLRQVRGQWFNCTSNVFAFLTLKVDKQEDVDRFQHLFVRLMSMLYASAIQSITSIDNAAFEIIENDGMSQEWLTFLENASDQPLIILQWVQRLIVNGQTDGVITIAPPILSRTFQELSQGIVGINEAFNIAEFPFPFPYAQMVDSLLLLQGILTPLALGMSMTEAYFAGLATFFIVFGYRCINFIGMEIEQPFGDDANDLPMLEMVADMNYSLLTLMDPRVQNPPKYEPHTRTRAMGTKTWTSRSNSLRSRPSLEDLQKEVSSARHSMERHTLEVAEASQTSMSSSQRQEGLPNVQGSPYSPGDGGTGSAQASSSQAEHPSVSDLRIASMAPKGTLLRENAPQPSHAVHGGLQEDQSAPRHPGSMMEELVEELRTLRLLAREVVGHLSGASVPDRGTLATAASQAADQAHNHCGQPVASVPSSSIWRSSAAAARRSGQAKIINKCEMCWPAVERTV